MSSALTFPDFSCKREETHQTKGADLGGQGRRSTDLASDGANVDDLNLAARRKRERENVFRGKSRAQYSLGIKLGRHSRERKEKNYISKEGRAWEGGAKKKSW